MPYYGVGASGGVSERGCGYVTMESAEGVSIMLLIRIDALLIFIGVS